MARTIILRFRDLITEDDGTVNEHASLIQQFGEVWWGWWMRQYESPPRHLFEELSNQIEKEGALQGFLFNSGTTKLYSTKIARILVAPPGDRIHTPDPEKSPSYYHRGIYPAWFLLRSIEEADFSRRVLMYDSFPTRPELGGIWAQLLGQKVTSLEQLRHIDVTLWVVHSEE